MSRNGNGDDVPFDVSFGVASDVGRRRRRNEDAYLCQAPVFLVADGMGGYAAGEVAAATALASFRHLVGARTVGIADMRSAHDEAVKKVAALDKGGGLGPGTTLSGVGIAENAGSPYWLVINVGDSRTYRISHGRLQQVSVDHSVVQELVEDGHLTAEEAERDDRKNVLTRAIGAGGDGEPDFWMIPAAPGDRMLVCSDGLTGELPDSRIEAILATEDDPKAAASRLVDEACVAGGRDNVTAIIVDAVGVGEDVDCDTIPRGATAGAGR